MSRSDMSDLEWQFIKSVLPNKSRGVKLVERCIGRSKASFRRIATRY